MQISTLLPPSGGRQKLRQQRGAGASVEEIGPELGMSLDKVSYFLDGKIWKDEAKNMDIIGDQSFGDTKMLKILETDFT